MALSLTFAYPGDLDTLTGGYIYDKKIIQALQNQGWIVERLSLGDAFPDSAPSNLQVAARRLAEVPAGNMLVIDGLTLGTMGDLASLFAIRMPVNAAGCTPTSAQSGFVALVHHPLALESGISQETAKALFDAEAKALAYASHIIVTSPTTADTLQSMFSINRDRISIVVPGTERPAMHQKTREATPGEPTILLSVGSIIARKGYDVLVNALSRLRDLDWELRIVGDQTLDCTVFDALQAQITRLNLSDRIHCLGTLSSDALDAQFAQADVFVLASHYEGYGMAYAQALMWGLPVIGTTGGATRQTVPETAGILVEPGNTDELTQALHRLITAPGLRERLAHAAQKHAQALPSWEDSARLFGQIMQKNGTRPTAPDPGHTNAR